MLAIPLHPTERATKLHGLVSHPLLRDVFPGLALVPFRSATENVAVLLSATKSFSRHKILSSARQ